MHSIEVEFDAILRLNQSSALIIEIIGETETHLMGVAVRLASFVLPVIGLLCHKTHCTSSAIIS